MPKKGLPYVEVIWKDAWADPTRELDVADAYQLNAPVRYRTRGWLIDDDAADGVLLVPEQNLEQLESYRGPMHIPRGMVESVEELEVRKKRVMKPKPLHDAADSGVMPDSPTPVDEN